MLSYTPSCCLFHYLGLDICKGLGLRVWIAWALRSRLVARFVFCGLVARTAVHERYPYCLAILQLPIFLLIPTYIHQLLTHNGTQIDSIALLTRPVAVGLWVLRGGGRCPTTRLF